MTRWLLVVAALAGCAPTESMAPDGPAYDPEPIELGQVTQAAITCGRQTVAHGLVNVAASATTCVMSSECNASPKPSCAAPSDNLCACTARNAAGTCTAGRCVWHPDPAVISCVCVPGQLESCTTAGGAPGIQVCNATGTAWGAYS